MEAHWRDWTLEREQKIEIERSVEVSKCRLIAESSVIMASHVARMSVGREVVLEGVVAGDEYLEPFVDELGSWHDSYAKTRSLLVGSGEEDSLVAFGGGYTSYGLVREGGGWVYREWAPGAAGLALVGDFNGWDESAHAGVKDGYGVWEVRVEEGVLSAGDVVKTAVLVGEQGVYGTPGTWVHRIPAWAQRVEEEGASGKFHGVVVDDSDESYEWNHPGPVEGPGQDDPLIIYEAHVGIASEDASVGSYREFRENVLPRVARLGYNAIQLMAIMEHVYYGSFGYQVTSFFAASSRYGPREELKALIDEAHGLGLVVLLDVVHSHASKNVLDGLNGFDGTDHGYFHAPPRGDHPLWDSRVFDYSKFEVLRFLLSNIRYWLEVFRFDGMRFDGVTSMLYTHHGAGVGFTGDYAEYFGGTGAVDVDAVVYLKLANELIHEFGVQVGKPVWSIAEDVSGMPGLCRPVSEGGVGFDARLAMALPDMWIKMLKEEKDEEWDMGHIVHTLTNRRHQERTIAYVESHDQALVGDKTLAMWLMDAEMYTNMSVLSPLTPVIDRGMALHKMLRALTCMLGGDGWLTFMGNEGGHPEWLDFPREGNNYSHHYARRQWSLFDDDLLRYRFLVEWDAALLHAHASVRWMDRSAVAYVSTKHEGDKVIVFDVNHVVVVFNFHPTASYEGYQIGTPWPGKYKVLLDSDWPEFGGHGRNDRTVETFSKPDAWNGRDHSMLVYSCSRSVVVYQLVDE